jgi:DNA polymerase III alpha subunit
MAKLGLRKKFGRAKPEAIERLMYELNVFAAINGIPYLLFLVDAAGLAARRGIRFRCCGAAGGSLAFYSLGLTTLDPIRHGLFFEGFINPDQGCFPDLRIESGGENSSRIDGENGSIHKLTRKFKPKTFDDLCVLIALRHPCRAKQAAQYFIALKTRKNHVFSHPVIEAVLGETAGVLVYKEQMVRILQMAGGLTLSQAQEFKKNPRTGRLKSLFLAGALKRGLPKSAVSDLLGTILASAPFLESKAVAVEIAERIWRTDSLLSGLSTERERTYGDL